MKLRVKLLAFLSLFLMPCAYGYIVRQTIMERQYEDGFTERLVLLHDYHKADASVSTEQRKAIMDVFAKIQAHDPSAEMLLERPEENTVTRNVDSFFDRLTESDAVFPHVFSSTHFKALQKNSEHLMAGSLSISRDDANRILPVLHELMRHVSSMPGIGGKPDDQLLVQLGAAYYRNNAVHFLDQRVAVLSLAVALLIPLVTSSLFYDMPQHVLALQQARDINLSLHHIFSYINVFLDDTIERCNHAQHFFTACPPKVRDEIDAIKYECAAVKRDVAAVLQGLMFDEMYTMSFADFIENMTQQVYGNTTSIPQLVVRYSKVASSSCIIDAYFKTIFADIYYALVKLLVPVKNGFSLYDAWLASEMIRSNAQTNVIITGAAHAETLVPLLNMNGYEVMYDSTLQLINGLRIDSVKSLFGHQHVMVPSWPTTLCESSLINKKNGSSAQKLYTMLSLAHAQAVGAGAYYDHVVLQPLAGSAFDYALLPSRELAALQGVCLHDQHHVVRGAWYGED